YLGPVTRSLSRPVAHSDRDQHTNHRCHDIDRDAQDAGEEEERAADTESEEPRFADHGRTPSGQTKSVGGPLVVAKAKASSWEATCVVPWNGSDVMPRGASAIA